MMVSAESERRKREADPDSVDVVADMMLELGVSIDVLRKRLVQRGERYDFPLQVDLRKGLESGGTPWRHKIYMDSEELKRCVAADADLGIALVYLDGDPVKRMRPCDCEPGLHMADGDYCSPLKVVRGKIEIEATYKGGIVPGPTESIGVERVPNEWSVTFNALPLNNDAAFRRVVRDAVIPELSRLSVRAPRAELQIHHIDGDPMNNSLYNLEVVDPAENARAVVYGEPGPQLVDEHGRPIESDPDDGEADYLDATRE